MLIALTTCTLFFVLKYWSSYTTVIRLVTWLDSAQTSKLAGSAVLVPFPLERNPNFYPNPTNSNPNPNSNRNRRIRSKLACVLVGRYLLGHYASPFPSYLAISLPIAPSHSRSASLLPRKGLQTQLRVLGE